MERAAFFMVFLCFYMFGEFGWYTKSHVVANFRMPTTCNLVLLAGYIDNLKFARSARRFYDDLAVNAFTDQRPADRGRH